MKCQYTAASETETTLSFTSHDLFKLISIVESYSGDDMKWFCTSAARTMREAIDKMANAMVSEAEYIKEKNNV